MVDDLILYFPIPYLLQLEFLISYRFHILCY
ncbi:hypothetical protein T11_7490 [Trichinella zimbabwensis]|uniref:Uncharacterized protein n=1 Tax=Trichinella zimbabwensis TaxID=268475 RepID=A0A0V1EZ50_9BILA|nr:hypothetical protein T11_7490 [Trichinella zimbabwensis]